jgi:hypothetical protein
MIIERKSMLTGKVHRMDLPVTAEQLLRWADNELIQNVFPELTIDQREFLMTGTTPEEWDRYLSPGEV